MPKKPESNRFDRSDLLSALALLMSLGAIFVSMRQTTILKDQQLIMADQQEIMASQLEGSVWPYLETNISVSELDGTRTVIYTMTNKGVGPAKITQFSFQVNGKVILNARDLLDAVVVLEEFQQLSTLSFDLPVNEVLAPNETQEVYRLDYRYTAEAPNEFISLIGEEKICYYSIYDKCYGSCK